MSQRETPWDALEAPDADDRLNSYRVDPAHPWNFYWARGTKTLMLVLRHRTEISVDRRLPNFNGVRVTNVPADSGNDFLLVFELLEQEHRELFQRLCHDIVASTSSSPDEETAVETAIGRTWRWHHLLRGGSDERLGVEQQRGLVGELLTIIDVLEPQLGIKAAIDAWTGPLGTPKDFELGVTCIENKARRSAARPVVRIASEVQLDRTDTEYLYLVIRDVDQVPPGTPSARSLADLVQGVEQLIAQQSGTLLDFHARLSAIGFRLTDDYTDISWLAGKRRIYNVTDSFPRIEASALPDGVMNVTYCVSMNAIDEYEITSSQLEVVHHANQH